MEHQHLSHQPTLRSLLTTEALAEAQILSGENILERPIVQVVSQFEPPPSPGSLVVISQDQLDASKVAQVQGLAGVVFVTLPDSQQAMLSGIDGSTARVSPAQGNIDTLLRTDITVKRLANSCRDQDVPLIVVRGFGDTAQMLEDIRLAFLKETKTAGARIHSILLSLVMEEGLDGLVEQLHEWLDRPVAVETADFELLASRDMSGTPKRQQKQLTDAALEIMKKCREEGSSIHDCFLYPVRLGRRVSIPILYGGELIAGFISVMVRPSDKHESFIWYLQPAALASLVDISIRSKGDFGLTAAHRNLLKDLLSGKNMSAAEMERLERHFGFDLFDGFCVFAIQLIRPEGAIGQPAWPQDSVVGIQMENSHVYVVPFTEDTQKTWQSEAGSLLASVKAANSDCTVQIGAGRTVSTLMELPETYRDARQALIIGSMIHAEKEFVLGYEELGVKRLLYLLIDHPELDRFYEEVLEPLESYDQEWESDLMDTLKVYLEHGANLNSAARALFVHRHTLRYRLEQISETLKVDIDSAEVLLNLQIAFLIRELKGKSI